MLLSADAKFETAQRSHVFFGKSVSDIHFPILAEINVTPCRFEPRLDHHRWLNHRL